MFWKNAIKTPNNNSISNELISFLLMNNDKIDFEIYLAEFKSATKLKNNQKAYQRSS